jgi:hypothetical protein
VEEGNRGLALSADYLAMPAEDLSDPWAWQPSASSWFLDLSRVAGDWQTDPDLRLDEPRLKLRLLDGCHDEERWLRHPCMNVLTSRAGQSIQRDFQAAVWIAAHSEETIGTVNLPEPLWAWACDGGSRIPAGRHELSELGQGVAAARAPVSLALDVWCGSLGFAHAGSWADAPPASDAEAAQLEMDIVHFLRTMTLAETLLPNCASWCASVVQVAIPFRRRDQNGFRSSSSSEVPGLVVLDIHVDGVAILEALVHEAAHHHLFLAEASAPLVIPDHSGLYHSPLRSEPRPLRGILLAFHALAYIGCLYAEATRSGLRSQDAYQETMQLRQMVDDAAQTLTNNRRFLTDDGNCFLDRTLEVAQYGRS